jgi:hypothetical protein
MLPSQKHTVKSFPAPREFSPNDWQFDVNRAQELNWRPGTAEQSDFNYFCQNEPHQNIKNSMFNPLTGQEPIYGHRNDFLNPLDQEQTNAHMAGYKFQKASRVADNVNPFQASLMAVPSNRYPTNIWLNSYKGSQSRPRYN